MAGRLAEASCRESLSVLLAFIMTVEMIENQKGPNPIDFAQL